MQKKHFVKTGTLSNILAVLECLFVTIATMMAYAWGAQSLTLVAVIWMVVSLAAMFSPKYLKIRRTMSQPDHELRKSHFMQRTSQACQLFFAFVALEVLSVFYAPSGDLPAWAMLLDMVYMLFWTALIIKALSLCVTPIPARAPSRHEEIVHSAGVALLLLLLLGSAYATQVSPLASHPIDKFKIALHDASEESVSLHEALEAIYFVMSDNQEALEVAASEFGIDCSGFNSALAEMIKQAHEDYIQNPNYSYFNAMRSSAITARPEFAGELIRYLDTMPGGGQFVSCSTSHTPEHPTNEGSL